MNALHCRRWLEAWRHVDPLTSWDGALSLLDALPSCEWEGGLRADSPAVARLIAHGRPSLAERAAAEKILGLDRNSLAVASPSDSVWLDARWDAAARAWRAVDVVSGAKGGDRSRRLVPHAGPERRLTSKPFRPKDFGEPSSQALADFAGLCPVKRVVSIEGKDGWTLELERPLPWPLFLRCDVSASFQGRQAQLSLLLRDAKVRALEFDGEALWARFIG